MAWILGWGRIPGKSGADLTLDDLEVGAILQAGSSQGSENSMRGTSSRVDEQMGIVEEADFFGGGHDRLFGFYDAPLSGSPVAGVVMCGPILSQFRAQYRHGTLTARELAARGVAVQRFHYRGMGNSDGDVWDLSLESMSEDAAEAGARLRERTGSAPIAYLGVNVGGYAAARASRDGSMLILDTPPESGRQYLRNAVRAHGIYTLKRPNADGVSIDSVHEQLREGSRNVSLLGCRLGLPLFDSLMATSLGREVGENPRPTMFIGLGHEGSLRTDSERIRSGLIDSGMHVEVRVRDKVDPFWYAEYSAPEDQPEIAETAEWVAGWLTGQAHTESEGR